MFFTYERFFIYEICVCVHLTQTRYAQKMCAEMRISMTEYNNKTKGG